MDIECSTSAQCSRAVSRRQAAAAARSRCIVSYRSVQCIAFRRSCRRGRSSHRLASVNRLHASSRLDGRHDLLHLICLYDSPLRLFLAHCCTARTPTLLHCTVPYNPLFTVLVRPFDTQTQSSIRGDTHHRREEESTAQHSAAHECVAAQHSSRIARLLLLFTCFRHTIRFDINSSTARRTRRCAALHFTSSNRRALRFASDRFDSESSGTRFCGFSGECEPEVRA